MTVFKRQCYTVQKARNQLLKLRLCNNGILADRVNTNSYQHKGTLTLTQLKIRLILSYFITCERKKWLFPG